MGEFQGIDNTNESLHFPLLGLDWMQKSSRAMSAQALPPVVSFPFSKKFGSGNLTQCFPRGWALRKGCYSDPGFSPPPPSLERSRTRPDSPSGGRGVLHTAEGRVQGPSAAEPSRKGQKMKLQTSLGTQRSCLVPLTKPQPNHELSSAPILLILETWKNQVVTRLSRLLRRILFIIQVSYTQQLLGERLQPFPNLRSTPTHGTTRLSSGSARWEWDTKLLLCEQSFN